MSKFIGAEYGAAGAQVNAPAAHRVFRFSLSARIAMLQPMAPLPDKLVRLVRAALAEDVGTGDATTLAMVPEDASANAAMVAREELVVCGVQLAIAAFQEVDATTRVRGLVVDGGRL